MATKNLLGAGAVLHVGESLVSPDGKSKAILQEDGNFVVYKDGKDIFATHTYKGSKQSSVPELVRLFFNTFYDEMFVFDDFFLLSLTEHRRNFKQKIFFFLSLQAGHTLIPQEDGNLVIYASPEHGNRPIWATNTVGKNTGRVTLALGDEGLLVLVD